MNVHALSGDSDEPSNRVTSALAQAVDVERTSIVMHIVHAALFMVGANVDDLRRICT